MSSTSMGQQQCITDHHITSNDVTKMSVDGWQSNEDAVVMTVSVYSACIVYLIQYHTATGTYTDVRHLYR